MNVDYKYIASLIGNMSGIPVRVYEHRNLVYIYSLVSLPKDPIDIDIEEIKKKKNHIDYFINEDFYYYGIINSGSLKMVIGPSRGSRMNKQELREYSFKVGVPPPLKNDFISALESITTMPLPVILEMLCSINYLFNEEKLYVSDVLSLDNTSFELPKDNVPSINEDDDNHNTLMIEETVTNIVKNGDVASLMDWSKNAPSLKSGKLSNNQIRNLKNTFIVTATLVSRAAIKGGMSVNDAFSLSDLYIQKCELLNDYESISGLQFQMVKDYTEKVKSINYSESKSRIVGEVTNYVYHHLSEPIKTIDIAESLGLSRSHLSTTFSKAINKTISDYIYEIKINEAKKLLRNSNQTIESISDYLGFMSQAHFTKIFKNKIGKTPNEYRKRK